MAEVRWTVEQELCVKIHRPAAWLWSIIKWLADRGWVLVFLGLEAGTYTAKLVPERPRDAIDTAIMISLAGLDINDELEAAYVRDCSCKLGVFIEGERELIDQMLAEINMMILKSEAVELSSECPEEKPSLE